MIHSVRFKAVLDTNVIFPIVIRDLLFWFAHYELYTPKWSAHIFDEWKDVVLRKGVTEGEATKRIEKANLAFPDALVQNYGPLITHLPYPGLTKILNRYIDSIMMDQRYRVAIYHDFYSSKAYAYTDITIKSGGFPNFDNYLSSR